MSEAFAPGGHAWVAGDMEDWHRYVIKARHGKTVKLEPENGGKSIKLHIKKDKGKLVPANEHTADDMTSLQHIDVPNIMHNLRIRSLENKPYTFLGGSVLVAVNPLHKIKDKKNVLGKMEAVSVPHPYAIAEGAYQQLVFGIRRGKESETPVNQSIIVGGESGAGKTESSKMVLKHLVARCITDGNSDEDLDRRLIESNPILEAFGNASTKRNHNSSRFGKFMKVHYKYKKKKNKVTIFGASVNTYLLERSRVTHHVDGERTYHVFYQLVNGAGKKLKKKLKLDEAAKFEYLTPKEASSLHVRAQPKFNKRASLRLSHRMPTENEDKKHFKKLHAALQTTGVATDDMDEDIEVFKVVAAILHLGNVTFKDKDSSEGNVASISDETPLEIAAKLLDIKPKALAKVVMERKVKTIGEEVIKKRDARAAKYALDAVVKYLYVGMFDWLVSKITESLSEKGSLEELPFIGVLDIFGFETFRVNDFEQLLINYANEALQSCFNIQIFEGEASLYEREGLLVHDREMPPDNSDCVELLQGDGKKAGILTLIDSEGRNPQANDDKLNSALQRQFKGHGNFPHPHPKDARHCFIVKHYASDVKYTVGSFLEKNSDQLPDEVGKPFKGSSLEIIQTIFSRKSGDGDDDDDTDASSSSGKKKKKNNKNAKSITIKFKTQMSNLVDELNETRCTFIRCIKPNASMKRNPGATDWFDNLYVLPQLKNLSIPQTSEVLKGGLPTRVDFNMFFESYSSMLPKSALKVWKSLGHGDEKQFVKALFYAFDIPPDAFKVGMTKVFFKSGMLETVNTMLNEAMKGDSVDKKVAKKFKEAFTRALRSRIKTKLIVLGFFLRLLHDTRERKRAETIRQRMEERKLLEMQRREEEVREREEKERKARKEAKKIKELEKKKEHKIRKAIGKAETEEEAKELELELALHKHKVKEQDTRINHLSLLRERRKELEGDVRRSVRFEKSREGTPSVRFVLTEEQEEQQEKRTQLRKSWRRSYAADRKLERERVRAALAMDSIQEEDEDEIPSDEDEDEEERPLVLPDGVYFQKIKPQFAVRRSSFSNIVCFKTLFRPRKGSVPPSPLLEEDPWRDCCVAFNGFQIRYFAECDEDDKGEPIGRGTPLGILQVDNKSSLAPERGPDGELKKDTLIFSYRLMQRTPTPMIRFKFDDEYDMRDFMSAYERTINRFKFEMEQARKYEAGEYDMDRNPILGAYKEWYDRGLITRDELEKALVYQVTTEDQMLDVVVGQYGEEGYADYKIQCPDCFEFIFNLPTEPLDECPYCGCTDLDTPEDIETEVLLHRSKVEEERNKAFELIGTVEQTEFPFYMKFDMEKFEFDVPALVTQMNNETYDTEYYFQMHWSRQVNDCNDWDEFLMSTKWEELRDFMTHELPSSGQLTKRNQEALPPFPQSPKKFVDQRDLAEQRLPLVTKYLLDLLKCIQKEELFQSRLIRMFLGMAF